MTGVGQGLKQNFVLSVGPDVSYRPDEYVTLHFFYNFEMLFYNDLGNGACSTPASVAASAGGCAGTAGYFRNTQTSTTETVGLSIDWRISDRLKLQGDYTLSYGSVMFGEFNGVFVKNATQSYQNVSNYPDINSVLNSVRLTATYRLADNMDLVFRAGYIALHNNDWNNTANAIQGAGSSSIATLTPGYSAPNYNVATLIAAMRVRF